MRYALRVCLLVILSVGLMVGCSSQNNPSGMVKPTPSNSQDPQGGEVTEPTPTEPSELTDPIKEQLKTLSTAEKVGQLVLVGMEGTKPDSSALELIETYQVGGFIFYKDNIKDSASALSLFNELKLANVNADHSIPLFMSVDEEGGRVTRMPKEFTKVPTAAKIGEAGSTELANGIGQAIGTQLSGFGLNMDFAPVLDVNSNPDNPVIGDRSYGDTAEIVSEMGIAAMKGLDSQGVVPVVKHFPGHGDTSVDSHLGLPVVNHGIDRLRNLELRPFKDAIAEGVDVVMIAHLLMPKLDPDHPASFSKIVINDLLREELGFEGVVISDDMTMGAIAEHYEIGEVAVQFIQAGGNIVLIGHDYEKERAVINALTEAVEQGTISEDMLDERVYAILKLKQKYQLSDEPAKGPDVKEINAELSRLLKDYGLK
ncbi:beta-N-acetylhexosaminidase [Paenibacillus segetis]|uniref:Glycoside hydrolase family 3 n=1 Tax=Paenibacillus segetis TaxID=1325360 RepID=A0ABQ1YQR8_9BACL|nr:beta-N-acetylhexosaminidase [Paenibacillus segetis]GGH34281.1 glycoside hydrolase family 3 [Paenibacillus segetis]